MAKLWQHSNERGGWNPNFPRPLNDWEIVIVERFLARLQVKVVDEDKEDKVCWVETKSEIFSVKSLYASLETGGAVQFPTSVVWNAWVQPKASFFAWEVTWGKALTLDQLQRRGGLWLIVISYVCLMRSQLTTSFCIVARQGCCGSYYSFFSKFIGRCNLLLERFC